MYRVKYVLNDNDSLPSFILYWILLCAAKVMPTTWIKIDFIVCFFDPLKLLNALKCFDVFLMICISLNITDIEMAKRGIYNFNDTEC